MMEMFRNEPFTDFAQSSNVEHFQAALAKVRSQLGREYPLIIEGKPIDTPNKARSINPAHPAEIVGVVAQADRELADRAVRAAAEAFPAWNRIPGRERARYLFKAAAMLRRRKHEFSAWMVVEAGKSWTEADIDTAEAIDFMEFYGREMERLEETQPLHRLSGENNELTYVPLGVGVVIPPWNFPLAILVGMTTSALVTGNTVVLKPASPTPVVAAKFVELLHEAGFPPEIVAFLPGPGSEIGDALVDHPLTRVVSFTGSRDVGLRINERAAKTGPGQKWIKRVVAELGGKDTIVVDSDCDIELAAEAIALSAFGFAGQKCSACSRAVVHADVYDEVLARVVERARALTVDDPASPSTYMGPVIDDKAYAKIREYIEIGRGEGRLVFGGGAGGGSRAVDAEASRTISNRTLDAGHLPVDNEASAADADRSRSAKKTAEFADIPGETSASAIQGYFIEPTIFADVAPDARIAQEEIFGPVLAFLKASSYDEALTIANNTVYGLTGAVISRNRQRLEQARREFHVGNLYFNRKCTGALVGVHPFGGFNLSGTDSKAGGRDYLQLFLQAKLVSEKL